MNINEYIFSRCYAKTKVEAVKALSTAELLCISEATIRKMIVEAGENEYKSRNKILRVPYTLRAGNDWNSEFKSIGNYKGVLCVNLYLQYGNTDTDTSDTLESFLRKGDYRGAVSRSDRYGNPRTYYFTYTDEQKAECIRSFVLAYLYVKYADKLNSE